MLHNCPFILFPETVSTQCCSDFFVISTVLAVLKSSCFHSYRSYIFLNSQISCKLERCLEVVLGWMGAHRLKLNPDKMEAGPLGGRSCCLWIGGLPYVFRGGWGFALHQGWGLQFWHPVDSQIASGIWSVYFHLRQIAQLHLYFDTRSLAMLVHALVFSRIDYCNARYVGLPLGLIWNLQQVQNMTAILVRK